MSSTLIFALVLFVGMIAFSELGRLYARRRARRDPEGTWQGTGVVDGAVFALLGLIIAFTFSGAASRFDSRRAMIIEEVNAIGTAWLRLDLLPAVAQPALRDMFRRYLESRIRTYERFPDVTAVEAELAVGNQLQGDIWAQATRATQGSQPATMLLLPALNQAFDIASSRSLSTMIHPPPVVYALLFGLALIGAMLVGYGMARARSRGWLHITGFAAVTAIAFYVIVDIEYPRLGAIRVDAIDQALRTLRSGMN